MLSAVVPSYGLALRQPLIEKAHFSSVHFMLAALLFTLGLSVPLGELMRIRDAWRWLGGYLSIRLFVVAFLSWTCRGYFNESSGGFPADSWGPIVGLLLVAAAPTAASSAGWSMQMKASKSLTAILILGTTLMSIAVVPFCLAAAASAMGGDAGNAVSAIRQNFSAAFVLPWVFCPVVVGMATRACAPRLAVRLRKLGHYCNPFVLLLLNYSNGATSLSRWSESMSTAASIATLGGAVGMFVVLCLLGTSLGKLLRADRSVRDSFTIGASMSNTGLILVVATLALPDRVEVHLPIIFYTFVQHIGVALFGRSKFVQGPDSRF